MWGLSATEGGVVLAQRQVFPEARPSGIVRAVQARKRNHDVATVWLVVFVVAVVAASLYIALG